MTIQWADVGSVEQSFAYDDTATYVDGTTHIAFRGISGLIQQLYVGNRTTYITKDGSNNLSFTDAVLGTRTLSQLAGTVWGTITGTLSDQTDLNNALAGKQPLDAELTALAGLTSAANKLPYFTGSGTAALTDLSVFARTFLDDADAATVIATLGLGSVYQPLDAELSAIASLTSAADSLPYFTGVGTAALTTLTSFARSILDDANAATVIATLGLGSVYQQLDAELTALAGLTSAADKLPYFTGSGTAALADLTAAGRALIDDATADAQLTTLGITTFIKTLLDDTDALTARATLGLAIGTNVQAYDAELAALAGLTSAADSLPYFTGSGTAALATLTAFARTILDDADQAAVRSTLALTPGTNVQAYSANLTAIAALAVTDSNIIVGNGSTWVAESGATARTSLGLGTGDTPTFNGLALSNASSLVYTSNGILFLRAYATTGNSALFIEPISSDGAGAATLGLFRNTNTAGIRAIYVYKGDGTGTITLAIGPLGGNITQFGTSANTFAGVTNFTATGIGVIAGATASAADEYISIRTAAGYIRMLALQTGTANRWLLGADNAAESGANVGSDFKLYSYTDAGGALSTPITITRSSSLVTLSGSLLVDGTYIGLTADADLVKLAANLLTVNGSITATGILTAGSGPTTLTNAAGTIKESALEAGELSAIAGLTSAADRLPYFTGSNTAALATFTSFARTLLDDADAATARATLGLTTATFFIPAALFQPCATALYNACGALAQIPGTYAWGLACPESPVTHGAMATVGMPADYNSGNINVDIFWTTTVAGTSSTSWGCLCACRPAGGPLQYWDATYYADPDPNHPSSASGGQYQTNIMTSFPAFTPYGAAPSTMLHLFIGRVADDAGDDLAGTAYILGVRITYTRS